MSAGGRTNKAIKNIVFNVINQIITLVLSFISRWVFIKGFGIGYLGLNGLFSDILSLLSMADLGFNTAMVFSFYKPLADNDHKHISALIGFYKRIYFIIAFAISVIGIALIPFLPLIVKLEYEVPYLTLYYLLSLSSVVSSYLCIYKTSILTADQKGYKVTKITIITNFLKTIIQVVSIVLFKNYILYLAIGTVVTIFNNIIASRLAQKEYPYINDNNELPKNEKKQILHNISSVFLYKISSVLLNATDNIIISIIIGTVFVGLYSNYFIIQTKITALFSLFFTSMIASIGNLIVTENKDKRFEIFKCEQSMSYIFSGIVCSCYVLLADDFVKLWIGSEFQLDFHTTCAIGLNLYLSCVLQPLWSYREATGLYRKTKWVMFICAIENIILSIFLGKTIGITGVIFASAISRISTYVWYEPKILFYEYFGIKPKKYYFSILSNTFLIILIILLLYFLLSWFKINNWFNLIIKSAIIGSITTIIMIIIYHKSEGFAILKERVILLLKQKL